MSVNSVGHPWMADVIHCTIPDLVGVNPKIVAAVGCTDPIALARSVAPATFSNNRGKFIVVEDPTSRFSCLVTRRYLYLGESRRICSIQAINAYSVGFSSLYGIYLIRSPF